MAYLHLIRARLLPDREPDLVAFLEPPAEGTADPYAQHLREALGKAHRSGAVVYFAVESFPGGDPLRRARDLLEPYMEFVSVTSVEATDEEGDDDDEEKGRPKPRSKPAKGPKQKSRASREED